MLGPHGVSSIAVILRVQHHTHDRTCPQILSCPIGKSQLSRHGSVCNVRGFGENKVLDISRDKLGTYHMVGVNIEARKACQSSRMLGNYLGNLSRGL